jgi:hypothetical protein
MSFASTAWRVTISKAPWIGLAITPPIRKLILVTSTGGPSGVAGGSWYDHAKNIEIVHSRVLKAKIWWDW